MSGSLDMEGRLTWGYAAEFFAACLVQAFMLVNVGCTYLLLRWRNRANPKVPGVSPLKPYVNGGLVSVIIPAYNEARKIESVLKSLDSTIGSPDRVEILVVDAGGSDGTMAIAERVAGAMPHLDIRTNISARGGRGPTLIAGAEAARGDVLLFLHGDTTLPDCFDAMVRTELSDEKVLATAFSFHVDRDEMTKPIAGLSMMEFTVNIRSRFFELPFGDQAMAITKQRYDALGGFPNEPIMEDFELVQRLRRCGAAGSGYIKTLPAGAACSARRWHAMSIWRTNLINQVIMIMYVYFGYTPAQIYGIYYGTTKGSGADSPKTKVASKTGAGESTKAE